jgi:hypothetical protein
MSKLSKEIDSATTPKPAYSVGFLEGENQFCVTNTQTGQTYFIPDTHDAWMVEGEYPPDLFFKSHADGKIKSMSRSPGGHHSAKGIAFLCESEGWIADFRLSEWRWKNIERSNHVTFRPQRQEISCTFYDLKSGTAFDFQAVLMYAVLADYSRRTEVHNQFSPYCLQIQDEKARKPYQYDSHDVAVILRHFEADYAALEPRCRKYATDSISAGHSCETDDAFRLFLNRHHKDGVLFEVYKIDGWPDPHFRVGHDGFSLSSVFHKAGENDRPIFEQDGIQIYQTLDGLEIHHNAVNERYYVLPQRQIFIRAPSDLEDIPVGMTHDQLQILSLGEYAGNYRRAGMGCEGGNGGNDYKGGAALLKSLQKGNAADFCHRLAHQNPFKPFPQERTMHSWHEGRRNIIKGDPREMLEHYFDDVPVQSALEFLKS